MMEGKHFLMNNGEAVAVEKPLSIIGVIAEEFKLVYQAGKRDFYRAVVSVLRNSGVEDFIPVVVDGSLINLEEATVGKSVKVCGSIRTRNYDDEKLGKRCLDVFVHADEIIIDEYVGLDRTIPEDGNADLNEFDFEGYICKEPVFRSTPLGKAIADVTIAVNRENKNISDYLPCIFWGKNASEVSEMHVGDRIRCRARFQSREYLKKYEDGTSETRVAREISVCKFDATGESNVKSEDNE